MPEIKRESTRMDCGGLDLVHVIDQMSPGMFPYLENARVVVEGRLEGREGYTQFGAELPSVGTNSIRRLNDVDHVYNSLGWAYFIGNSTDLYFGDEVSGFPLLDNGFDGLPIWFIPFRPNNSPTSWMYCYNGAKQIKVRSDGVVRNIGVPPPLKPPVIEYGRPAMATIDNGDFIGSWVAYDDASTPVVGDRTNGDLPHIVSINYINGVGPGWACMGPVPHGNDGLTEWAGNRMRVYLNQGGPNEEIVLVREIYHPIGVTTVESIKYDSGTTGPCTMIIAGSPANVYRNSLIDIDFEVIRVLSVTPSLDGLTYSIRCNPGFTHVAGATMVGLVSWYIYTEQVHSSGEPITLPDVGVTNTFSGGVGSLATLLTESISTLPGRPIDTANDWMHTSIFLSDPTVVTNVKFAIDIDPNTTSVGSGGNAFTSNYWEWTITPDQLNRYGPGHLVGDSWTEVSVLISAGQRYGSDPTLNFSSVRAIRVQVTDTATCNFAFDCWYMWGTYGPTVVQNSPVGLSYLSTARDSSTGAASIPSPITRYQLFPLREEIVVTPDTSDEAGVDVLDIYRTGNSLTGFVYDGTVPNIPSNPRSYNDVLPDAAIEGLPAPDLSLIQPWPIEDIAWQGTVNVVGTSVIWVSGTKFNTKLLANTVILINGTSYLTYGQPISDTLLEINADGATLNGVSYEIQDPVLFGQPLPYAFGPLEGPFAPVIFALGDVRNAGKLYFSNVSNADAASDQNNLELCSPSEPLVSGDVWNGLVIVGSRDNLFLVRYSYLATIGESSNLSYQYNRLPNAAGIWCQGCCVRTPLGVAYLGRDGLYMATDQGSKNITDGQLYPMFPHDGQPAAAVNGVQPVNMNATTKLRLSYTTNRLIFDYVAIDNTSHTLDFDIAHGRWFYDTFDDEIDLHYLVEDGINTPNNQAILLTSGTSGRIYIAGGNTDAGVAITTTVTTPSKDGGDQRLQKLFMDNLLDGDGNGVINATLQANDQTVNVLSQNFNWSGMRTRQLMNISSLSSLQLFWNYNLVFTWTGGPAGPRLYASEMSAYIQPYLSSFMVTQINDQGVTDWHHHRRLYAGLISNSPTLFTIQCQDGRVYGPYTIPSTGGKFRILPIMLDQNIKDLAFGYQLDGQGQTYALFKQSFTIEMKAWNGDEYVKVPVWTVGE